MILLNWDETAPSGPRMIALFGSGLIGAAIAQALRRKTDGLSERRLDWTWPEPAPDEAQAVEGAFRATLAAYPNARLAVIWAAGRSGFGSSELDMQTEHASLNCVKALARRLGAASTPGQRQFVHVSSAGGLFEGQKACGKHAMPMPLRPYGHGKLAQEVGIRADAVLGRRIIIRPSSVYGHVPGGRQGLISALIAAATQRRGAKIFGALTTQRDFVFAADIGRYVATRLFFLDNDETPTEAETALIAAGRPASVFEIIKLVEDAVGSPLHLNIDPRPENARDNTFLPSATPQGFRPTSLRVGIALTQAAIARENPGTAPV